MKRRSQAIENWQIAILIFLGLGAVLTALCVIQYFNYEAAK